MAATHTCVNTATTIDTKGPPACVACVEELTARQAVRDQVLGRMIDQSRALATQPCETKDGTCYGCATCFARETVRMLPLSGLE
jgi:hypothetical protein